MVKKGLVANSCALMCLLWLNSSHEKPPSRFFEPQEAHKGTGRALLFIGNVPLRRCMVMLHMTNCIIKHFTQGEISQ